MTENYGQLRAVQADGRPQPASQPMREKTALYYQEFTRGQLVAFRHEDGNWYLYAPEPVEIDSTSASQPVSAVPGRRW